MRDLTRLQQGIVLALAHHDLPAHQRRVARQRHAGLNLGRHTPLWSGLLVLRRQVCWVCLRREPLIASAGITWWRVQYQEMQRRLSSGACEAEVWIWR